MLISGAEEYDYPAIKKLSFIRRAMRVDLSDGRAIIIPLARYPRLADATRKQLENYEISPAGYGVHWPDLDEDLSVKGFLSPAPYPAFPDVVRDKPRGKGL